MNALKSRKKYDAEQFEKAYEERKQQKEEQIRNMTEEERAEYLKEQIRNMTEEERAEYLKKEAHKKKMMASLLAFTELVGSIDQ